MNCKQQELWSGPHLLLDCPNLLHRAYHTTGHLDGGVTFGFLKYVEWLRKEFTPASVCFCFDSRVSLRQKLYPGYRAFRERLKDSLSPEERDRKAAFYQEVNDLRTSVLPDLGFSNVFLQRGYEADDLIASLVRETTWKMGSPAIIVSSDKDLYQLLGKRVTMWNPVARKTYTDVHLSKDFFGISPSQWWCVKAIAGCSGDGVTGLSTVGDLTAAKFLRGLLPANSKKALLIESSEGQEIIRRNTPLVKLPFAGVETMEVLPDTLSVERWNGVVRGLGLDSLVRVV